MNLHVDWTQGCPSWINATKRRYSRLKLEEQFMASAFEEKFPNDTLPKIFVQPCCSPYGATKETKGCLPREQYKTHMDWLVDKRLDGHISGRVWQ